MEWALILKIGTPLILFIVLFYLGLWGKCKDKIDKLTYPPPVNIIEKGTASGISSNETKVHNQMLIEILLNFRNDYHDDHLAIEDRRNQASIIYFMVLTAILTYLLINPKEINSIKDLWPFFFVLAVIFLMYFLNVHFEDLKRKFVYRRGIVQKAIEMITNLDPSDKNWYILNLEKQEDVMHKPNKRSTRWYRKVLRMASPDISQIIYYLIPFTFVLFWTIFNWP